MFGVTLVAGACVGPEDELFEDSEGYRNSSTLSSTSSTSTSTTSTSSSSSTGCSSSSSSTTTTSTTTTGGEPPDPCPEDGQVWDPQTCTCVDGCQVDDDSDLEDRGPDQLPPAADVCDDAVIAGGCEAFAESVVHADRQPGAGVTSTAAQVEAYVQNTARTEEHDGDACDEDVGLKTQTATAHGSAETRDVIYDVVANGTATMVLDIQVNTPGAISDKEYTVAAGIRGIYEYSCTCRPGDDTGTCDEGEDTAQECEITETLNGEPTALGLEQAPQPECITSQGVVFEYQLNQPQLVMYANASADLTSDNNNTHFEEDAMHTAMIFLETHGWDSLGQSVSMTLNADTDPVRCGGRYHGEVEVENPCEDPGPYEDTEPGNADLIAWVLAIIDYNECIEDLEEFGAGTNSASISQKYVCETICESDEHNDMCRPEYDADLCRFGEDS